MSSLLTGHAKRNRSSTSTSLAHALIPELPALMHGSGDVRPELVNPHTVATLARFIERYVASLVSAALDAHDVFTDGQVVGGGACLGLPPFHHHGDYYDDEEDQSMTTQTPLAVCNKRARKDDCCWDKPITSSTTEGSNVKIHDCDSDEEDELPMSMLAPFPRRNSSSSLTNPVANTTSHAPTLLRGFAPVDFFTNERTRNYYVAAPSAMDARSFIFPICHDAVLYQRVKEIQASRRAIQKDVVDNALLEVMKEEGIKEGRRGIVDSWDAVLGTRANANNNVGGDNINDDAIGSKTTSPGGKKKKDGTTSNNKSTVGTIENEKMKSLFDISKAMNAGLVDVNVDPTWPGLDSVTRETLQ